MRNQLYLLLLCVLAACSSDATNEEKTADQPTPVVVNQDSIRNLYASYLERLTPHYPLACVAERNKLNPADAAPTDTTFFIFREQLRETVQQKDAFALMAFLDEDIQVGFDDENGLQAFIRNWKLDSPENIPKSDLWSILKEVLDLGGTFNGNREYFEAPYLGGCWPSGLEPSEYGAVIGAGVRLRSGTDLNTRVVKTLSYDILKFIETTPIKLTLDGETHPWLKVALVDGTEGYLYGKFYRSPFQYRAGFAKQDSGEWKMVRFLAGD